MSDIPYESAVQPAAPADQLVPPPQLTQVPRAVTGRAARRSWNELPARIWVILTGAVLLITLYFTITKYMAGRYERWLIEHGLPLDAEVMWIRGTQNPQTEFSRIDDLQVQIGYYVNGKRYELAEAQGRLTPIRDRKPIPTVRVGDKIAVRVDPNDPHVWTDRGMPRPWYVEFTIVLFLLPLLAFLGLMALWRRTQVLSIWKRGELAPAAALDLTQTAVAPFSRVVRFTLADGSDRRVYSTLHPAHNAPKSGDVIWVIFPRGKRARAIVASLYV